MMRGLKKIIYVFLGQLLTSFAIKRVWVGYLIGILVSLKSAYLYQGYVGDRVYQILEPYIINFMNGGNTLLMLIGFIVIVSDAPFVNNCSTLALYRSSRGQWFCGMSIYIIVHGFLYYIMSLVATIVFSLQGGYIQNLWSRPMYNLASFPSAESLVKWNMPQPGKYLIKDYTPVSALAFSVILILLYSLILTVIIFIFNAILNKAAGTAVAIVVHGIGYMMMYDGFVGALSPLSLYYNSIFIYHIDGLVSMTTSLFYLLLVLCVLLFLGPSMMHYADFKYSAGEKNE